MELKYEHDKIIIENKVITALDRFVLDFTSSFERYMNYVIVSGTLLFSLEGHVEQKILIYS